MIQRFIPPVGATHVEATCLGPSGVSTRWTLWQITRVHDPYGILEDDQRYSRWCLDDPEPRAGTTGNFWLFESEQFLRRATVTELPGRSCGLNSDWSVTAWHYGPGSYPNRTDGDVYVVEDDEMSPPEFIVCRRWYTDGGLADRRRQETEEDPDPHNDFIEEVATFDNLTNAVAKALTLAREVST